MIFYKENGISISGLKYVHLPYGPVPEKFDVLLGKLEADKIAHIEVELFDVNKNCIKYCKMEMNLIEF